MGTLTAFISAGSPPAGATRIPIFPPTLDSDGIASWYAPDDAAVDTDFRVTSLPPRVGSLKLVPSASGNAPLIQASTNGRKLMRTTIARADKLILEPTPAGSPWPNSEAAGMSFLMAMRMLDVSTTIKGLCNLFGLQVRHFTTSGSVQRVQIQRAYSGGTYNFEVPYDGSALSVLGITLDVSNVVSGVVTPILKIFRNGALIGSSTSANLTGLSSTAVGVIGALTNLGGTPSEAQLGDILMYSTVKSEAAMASISNALGALYA